MIAYALGAIVGLAISGAFIVRLTRGRRLERFEWALLIIATLAGTVFLGGLLQVLQRLLAT
jgi:hypothetical protein